MNHPSTPRRVLRGPNGSVAVEARRYAEPGRFTIVADDGDHRPYSSEATLAELRAEGWRELKTGEVRHG